MLLVVNAGSSSLKLAVFDDDLVQVAQARTEGISPDKARGHADALRDGLRSMGIGASDLRGAAHRIVHGGGALTRAARVTPQILDQIAACIPLAPLHNPANLAGIAAIADLAPDLPQFVSFDTAFHATNPALATTYALPMSARAGGLRRYGFHGLSYAAIVRKVQENEQNATNSRILSFHLGNGSSACAIRGGVSVATTMGYSPLDGLTMGTRSGGMDPNAVLHLAQVHGIAAAGRILNRESGLLGLGGASDLRALRAAGTVQAQFAIDHFAYWALRHAGSMIAAMGGLDMITFTGGIGENDADLRARICQGLEFLGVRLDAQANAAHAAVLQETHSNVAIWIVPAEEERQIAIEAMAVMAAELS